ncbi:MAG TPA: acyl-CoA dehydrogenase family protein [Streptosporangiaceae bacterium]
MVAVAQRIADTVLFPAALATDASEVVPRELLDALASSGLYGVGAEADFRTVCAVQEALASGCLTTAFIWAQHLGLVHQLVSGPATDTRARWLAPLAAGEVRAGVGLGGAAAKPTLHAQRAGQDWVLDGVSPFVSGWGRIDVLHVAARGPDDQIVWLIVDAADGPSLQTQRLTLAALNATATVRATFSKLLVAADRVTGLHPAGGGTAPEVLRLHAALALGVAARCCRLLGGTALDDELAALRTELDQLGPGIAAARAAAGQFALRAAAALMTSEGSRSLLVADHAQRLLREATFTLVYALRPASKSAVLAGLGVTQAR